MSKVGVRVRGRRRAVEGLEVSQAAVEAGERIGEGIEEAIPLPLAELGNDEPEHCQEQEKNEEVFHRRSADKYSMSFCKCQGKFGPFPLPPFFAQSLPKMRLRGGP